MRTILFCFEHLPACSLGCYGEWNIKTPEIDALASRALVIEQYYVSPQQDAILKSLNQVFPTATLIHSEQLPGEIAHLFAHRLQLKNGAIPKLGELQELLAGAEDGPLCIHFSPGTADEEQLEQAWIDWQRAASIGGEPDEADPGEPEAPIPDLPALSSQPEAKQRLMAHAAEVGACDAAFSGWLELLEQILEVGDLIVVTAHSGDARRITDSRPAWLNSLAEPLTHLPLLIYRVGDEDPHRSDGLMNHAAVMQLLQSRIQQQRDAETSGSFPEHPGQDEITYRSGLAVATRSREWLIVQPISSSSASPETEELELSPALFRKPEDIWEVHDVASQHPDLIESFLLPR